MIFSKKKPKNPEKKKSALRSWGDALAFALVVATFVRMLIFEAYAIPSGSMEGTLLINDHPVVDKMAYGPRLPMTPLSLPLVHNTIPLVGSKSYSDAVQWKYRRLPGYSSVQRNDAVVFNGPEADTVLAEQPDLNYYQACRIAGRQTVLNNFTIVTHPVDKRENLIKRCIAIAGDELTIKNGMIYVNGQQAEEFPHLKRNYIVQTNGSAPATDEELELVQAVNSSYYIYNLENEQLDAVRKANNVTDVSLYLSEPAGAAPKEKGDWVFPCDPRHFAWNRDNYGPLTIPKAGTTVQLTKDNIALYRRIISIYEGNTLDEREGKFYINGKLADSYTFKMDYYWMMGDNRHNSLDSRYWGFVPEDHIVGRAAFVYLSYGKEAPLGIRWNRLMRSITTLQQ